MPIMFYSAIVWWSALEKATLAKMFERFQIAALICNYGALQTIPTMTLNDILHIAALREAGYIRVYREIQTGSCRNSLFLQLHPWNLDHSVAEATPSDCSSTHVPTRVKFGDFLNDGHPNIYLYLCACLDAYANVCWLFGWYIKRKCATFL